MKYCLKIRMSSDTLIQAVFLKALSLCPGRQLIDVGYMIPEIALD